MWIEKAKLNNLGNEIEGSDMMMQDPKGTKSDLRVIKGKKDKTGFQR